MGQFIYNNKILPKDAATPIKVANDEHNKPSETTIKWVNTTTGGTTSINLPPDTIILPTGEKLIVESRILDGVSVTERIGRKPYEIEIEGTLRMSKTADGTGKYYDFNTDGNQLTFSMFPQDYINELFETVFVPDAVLDITNTLLNALGVLQIIVRQARIAPIAGSNNVTFRITAYENQPGESLIIN